MNNTDNNEEIVIINEVETSGTPNLEANERQSFFKIKEMGVAYAHTKVQKTMPKIVNNVNERNAIAQACNNSHLLTNIDVNGETDDMLVTLWKNAGGATIFDRNKLYPSILDTRKITANEFAEKIQSLANQDSENMGKKLGSLMVSMRDTIVASPLFKGIKYGDVTDSRPEHGLYNSVDRMQPGLSMLVIPNKVKDFNRTEFDYVLPCKINHEQKGSSWVLMSWEPDHGLEIAKSDVIFPVKTMAGGSILTLVDEELMTALDAVTATEELSGTYVTSLLGAATKNSKDSIKALYICALINAYSEVSNLEVDQMINFNNSYERHISKYVEVFNMDNTVDVVRNVEDFEKTFEACLFAGGEKSQDEIGEALVAEYEAKLDILEKEKANLELKRTDVLKEGSSGTPEDIRQFGEMITATEKKMDELKKEYDIKINALNVTKLEKFKLRVHKKKIEQGSANRVASSVSSGGSDKTDSSISLPVLGIGLAVLGGLAYIFRNKLLPTKSSNFANLGKLGVIPKMSNFTTGGDIIGTLADTAKVTFI